MRVTAVLDDERTAKLRRLQSLTQLSAAEIVMQGIDLLDCQQEERCREQLDAILASDFVGCLKDGPEDLASNYKAYLIDDLAKKSTDMRDFGVYRWKNTEPFENLLPSFREGGVVEGPLGFRRLGL